MTFQIGYTVTTPSAPDTHKRVCARLSGSVTLEWYDELGRQVETVNLDLGLTFVEDQPTIQWYAMKDLWEEKRNDHSQRFPGRTPQRRKRNGRVGIHFGNHQNLGAR